MHKGYKTADTTFSHWL